MTSCVYALKCLKTGHFYIGSTTDLRARTSHWRTLIVNGRGPRSFARLPRSFTDWKIVVLQEAEPSSLKQLELIYLEQSRSRKPEKLLNRQRLTGRTTIVSRSTYYLRLSKGASIEDALSPWDHRRDRAKTRIIDSGGKELTQMQAAQILGCRPKTLARRLSKARKKHGLNYFSIKRLQDLTREFRIC